MINIKPPEPQKWEMRMVVWKLEGVDGNLKGMDMGDMMDAQIAVALTGTQKQRTDTHLRAKEGKASFNWRLKFPVTLTDHMKYQRVTIQLWDKDLFTADYMIGDATLNLEKWFRRTFKKRSSEPAYWDGDRDPRLERYDDQKQSLFAMLSQLSEGLRGGSQTAANVLYPDPEVERSKLWVPLESLDGQFAGRVLVSIQLVPEKDLERLQCGEGRDEPNQHPALPQPVGRLFFTLNPFSLLYQFLGPKNCRLLYGICCALCSCILCVLFLYLFFPTVFGNLVTAPITNNMR